MDGTNALKSPHEAGQHPTLTPTPNLHPMEGTNQPSMDANRVPVSNSGHLQPQPINTIASSTPHQLKEKIEAIKGLTDKLHRMKAAVAKAFAPLLNFETSVNEVPPEIEAHIRAAQAQIDDYRTACQGLAGFIQETETHLNPNGTMFVAVKRKPDSPRERLKAKSVKVNALRKNPPAGPVTGIRELTDNWNAVYFKEAIPAGCFLSETDLSTRYRSIELKVLNEFTAVILIQTSIADATRRLYKINFFSTQEQTKVFEESEHFVFRALTHAGVEQLPFPSNAPNTFSIPTGDPLPFLLDWIYAFKDLFTTPCAKCRKVMVFTPTSPAKFLPPIVRRYEPTSHSFLPLHTWCAHVTPALNP
ncbi:hypothetical protein L0F63_000988 [Massospora cicadina]|nr:hypothetical protein L0F63_000988 [Massospora cicadina]